MAPRFKDGDAVVAVRALTHAIRSSDSH
jgi:hypothetical protein